MVFGIAVAGGMIDRLAPADVTTPPTRFEISEYLVIYYLITLKFTGICLIIWLSADLRVADFIQTKHIT